MGKEKSVNENHVEPHKLTAFLPGIVGRASAVFILSSFQPQTLQLDFLMKILPNYHHLKKTMKGGSTPVKN